MKLVGGGLIRDAYDRAFGHFASFYTRILELYKYVNRTWIPQQQNDMCFILVYWDVASFTLFSLRDSRLPVADTKMRKKTGSEIWIHLHCSWAISECILRSVSIVYYESKRTVLCCTVHYSSRTYRLSFIPRTFIHSSNAAFIHKKSAAAVSLVKHLHFRITYE